MEQYDSIMVSQHRNSRCVFDKADKGISRYQFKFLFFLCVSIMLISIDLAADFVFLNIINAPIQGHNCHEPLNC